MPAEMSVGGSLELVNPVDIWLVLCHMPKVGLCIGIVFAWFYFNL